jgi:hypothetical protein
MSMALTSLDISSNDLVGEKGTGGYEIDKEEEIMEPDFSGTRYYRHCRCHPRYGRRALSSLNLATNGFYAEGTQLLEEVLKRNTFIHEVVD